MGLPAKEKPIPPPIPQGVYLGVCCAVYDLGTHQDPRWNRRKRQCLLMWELPDLRGEFERDGQRLSLPRAISKKYTLSLGERAHLRKDLETWRNRLFTPEELQGGFDLQKLLAVPCQLQVLHNIVNGKIYTNITTVIPPPKGIKPTPETPLRFFSFEDGTVIPENTPDWIRDIIRQSDEYQTLGAEAVEGCHEEVPPPDEDEIPF